MRVLRKIVTVVLVFCIIVVLALSLMLAISKEKGYTPKIGKYSFVHIISESMEPKLKVNSLCVISQENSYTVEDIVTFKVGTSLLTHRVVAVEAIDGSNVYITKGDANDCTDKFQVNVEDIQGKVILNIEFFGKLLKWVNDNLFLFSLLAFAFVAVLDSLFL